LLPVVYDGVTIDLGYRMDLLVEDSVVVELKCVEAPNKEAQLLSYLKRSGKNIGLLVNFRVAHLREGIKRLVNGRNWEL
jgi:GxxExxY protein